MLDNRLSFRPHIEYVSQKAAKIQGSSARACGLILGHKAREASTVRESGSLYPVVRGTNLGNGSVQLKNDYERSCRLSDFRNSHGLGRSSRGPDRNGAS
ncbi:GH12622 [Drosophila grimshawi]|uniref:GH12622 n=1 Tax=Drosophila grimshawi TaxID=7222 RepID=B4JKA7_DROGR|nr:GH12622 [Drosophila grimshawi]